MISKQDILDRLDIKAFYSSELPSIKWNGSGSGQALCPFHDDKNPSLSVNQSTGQFNCFGCNAKGSIFDFFMKQHNVDYTTAFNALAKEAGLNKDPQRRIDKKYDYTDQSGALLFQTVRYEPKGFTQRRPDPNNKGKWIYNLKGIMPVPYNLTQVQKSDCIIIVEGEKDADNLKSIGLTATCNPMGTGKWKPDYNKYFKDKKVAILPDNDDSGRSHAENVAKSLKGISEEIRIVELPDLPEKGDVSDWIQASGTEEQLRELIRKTPKWTPESASQFDDTYNSRETGKLKLSNLRDIFNYPDPEYLIDLLLIVDNLILLTAYAGVGKSILSLIIAYAVVTGKALFDQFHVNKPGRVLIIDEESPGSLLKERLQKAGFTEGMDISFLHFQRVKLDNYKIYHDLIQVIKDLKPTLVIFDALIRLHNREENSTEMSLVMERLRNIVNLGTTVLVIHHHRKGSGTNKESVRGSSDILGGVDMCLSLEDKDGYLILSSQKTRSEPIEPIRLKLETEDDSLSFKYDGIHLPDDQIIVKEITDILKDGEKLSVKEILAKLKKNNMGIGENNLRNILNGNSYAPGIIDRDKPFSKSIAARNKGIYSINSTFTASQGIYRGGNCETGNNPDNDLHGFTEEAPLNWETENIKECVGSNNCNAHSYDMKLNPETRKLKKWCKRTESFCEVNT